MIDQDKMRALVSETRHMADIAVELEWNGCAEHFTECADAIDLLLAELEAAAADKREEPSLTNPLTPYGLLVRALRIVAGITLMDMATALLTTPAKLSAMEFGRTPVTPEFAFDVSAYFDALGVPHTASALRAAIEAPSLFQRQEKS
ncbi:helix-turn-helix domain-containing protein [Burkholderia sp. AW33-5]